jgi:hypothetical protein
MGQSPFAKRPATADGGAAKRRSTRVDYVCPIILSGRDAAGQAFREETQTATVNLHGCKLRTAHQVLVGMLVTLECPRSNLSGKAVCVITWDPAPGETAHNIAVQLVKPQNLWGLENPPPDWQAVAEALVHGRAVQPQRAAVATVSKPATTPVPATPPAPGVPAIDLRLADLEMRSAQIMESVLQIIRAQAEEIVQNTLEEFRQQVQALTKDAEEHLRQRAEQAYDDVASSLTTLRADLAEQLMQRTEQVVNSAEEALRTKVGELFATILSPAPSKPVEPAPKK